MRVCVLTFYGQLLVKIKELSKAYPYIKQANDLAVAELPLDDVIRGFAQAGYGCYLHFFHARELAIEPLESSLHGLRGFHPELKFLDGAVFRKLVENEVFLGLLDDAHQHYEQRIEALTQANETRRLGWLHNNFGLYLQKAGYHNEAMQVLDRGLAFMQGFTDSNRELIYVNILETKSHSLVSTGAFVDAMANLKQAYFTRKEKDRYAVAMQAMNYIIEYLMEADNYEEAYNFYTAEQSYFESRATMTDRFYKLYGNLGKLFDEMGRQAEAEQFYHAYNAFATDHVLPIAEARTQTPKEMSEQILLQNRAYEQQITISQLEADQLREKLRARKFGLVALALSFSIAGLAAFGWWWRRQRVELERKRAESDRRRILELENENLKYSLANQEKDIKRLAADNRLRTQLKRDILKQIEAVFTLPVAERDEKLRSLIRELSPTVEERAAISELQDRVETINAAFEDHLKERIPGITAQELRYCSLLRLGMNNQQIAQLLNKSDATIRIYKHRVNKKANLKGKNALQELVDQL
ncbi:MAG: hypothetical protein AAF741_19200 [Bacteroidota bacterium]